jgi:hypothetical protein
MPTTLYEAVIDWLEYELKNLDKKELILKVKDKKNGKEYFTSVDRKYHEGATYVIMQNFPRFKKVLDEKEVLEVYEVRLAIKKDPNGLYITPILTKISNREIL